MKKVAEEENLEEIIIKLQQVADIVLSAANMRCSLNTMPETTDAAVSTLETFIKGLPHQASQPPQIYTQVCGDLSLSQPPQIYTQVMWRSFAYFMCLETIGANFSNCI